MKRHHVINTICIGFAVIFFSVLFFESRSFSQESYSTKLAENSTPLAYQSLKKFFNLTVGGTTTTLEIADTPLEWKQGLSNRESLPPDRGLLFVFLRSGRYEFWMKDMRFPLDIIWIDEKKAIVHIEANISPDSYPKVFTSEKKARYVLEVNAGFVEKNNLRVGDILNLY